MIQIQKITAENFTETSLDNFIRTQPVTEVYRKIDGVYQLIEHPFTDEWTAAHKRKKARVILAGTYLTYGAFDGERVVGLIMLDKTLRDDRMIVHSFHVSQDYRRRGIGRKLFEQAVTVGRQSGAKKLYFSACSSKETIAFYTAMGCTLAEDIIQELAEAEPCDLQMEYRLP